MACYEREYYVKLYSFTGFCTKFVINETNLGWLQCMNIWSWTFQEEIAKDLCEKCLALFFVWNENKWYVTAFTKSIFSMNNTNTFIFSNWLCDQLIKVNRQLIIHNDIIVQFILYMTLSIKFNSIHLTKVCTFCKYSLN